MWGAYRSAQISTAVRRFIRGCNFSHRLSTWLLKALCEGHSWALLDVSLLRLNSADPAFCRKVLGIKASASEVEALLAEVDKAGTGELGYPAYVQVMTGVLSQEVRSGTHS